MSKYLINGESIEAIANGFRTSRGTEQKYTLDEMAVLAAEKVGGGGSIDGGYRVEFIGNTGTTLAAFDVVSGLGIYAPFCDIQLWENADGAKVEFPITPYSDMAFYQPRPSVYDAVFANNSWETIILACQANAVPETWVVGDQKAMTIGGTDYMVDIIGKGHDSYSDGTGTAPLTFQLHNSYNTAYNMNATDSNSGGWPACLMRTTHLPALMEEMPTEVRIGIKEVDKITAQGGTVETSAEKLFLLSGNEIDGTTSYSSANEGTQYEYYANGGSKIKTLNGTEDYWWSRSPRTNNTLRFCRVNNGGTVNTGNASGNHGVAFAFCF